MSSVKQAPTMAARDVMTSRFKRFDPGLSGQLRGMV
jgi:hypothetical protein